MAPFTIFLSSPKANHNQCGCGVLTQYDPCPFLSLSGCSTTLLTLHKAATWIYESPGDSGATCSRRWHSLPAARLSSQAFSHHHSLLRVGEPVFREHNVAREPQVKVEASPTPFHNRANCFPKPWPLGIPIKSSMWLEGIRIYVTRQLKQILVGWHIWTNQNEWGLNRSLG